MKWFSINARSSDNADIRIYDEIGSGGLSAKAFADELKALGARSRIDLWVNSPGGDVFDGITIYNLLKRSPARVVAHVDGVAASIASVVVMAADEVVMPSNAMMMIHDPAGLVVGNSRDMRQLADTIDRVKTSMVSIYVAKSGQPEARVRQMMEEETWFTAREAVDLGFADRVEDAVQIAAHFDLTKFKHPPTTLQALSDRIWTARGKPPPVTQPKGTTIESLGDKAWSKFNRTGEAS